MNGHDRPPPLPGRTLERGSPPRGAVRLVAGIGFRHACAGAEIAALVARALAEAGVPGTALAALATVAERADDAALREAAAWLRVPVIAVCATALRRADAAVPTRSARALAAHGVGSVAEAAALVAAGTDRLALARIASASATCALACETGALACGSAA